MPDLVVHCSRKSSYFASKFPVCKTAHFMAREEQNRLITYYAFLLEGKEYVGRGEHGRV
jgi:hypothetical protein